VRDDDEGKGSTGEGWSVAQGFAGDAERFRNIGLGRSGHGAFVVDALFFTGRNDGGIPDLDGQRPVVERGFTGVLIEMEDIGLAGVDEVKGADTHGIAAAGSEFRRVDRRHAEEGLLGEKDGGEESHVRLCTVLGGPM
jgi:hypothetical protein